MTNRIIKYTVLTVCGFVLFFVINRLETVRRGYAAIGGEMFFVLLLVLWWVIGKTIKDIARDLKNYKNGGKQNDNYTGKR